MAGHISHSGNEALTNGSTDGPYRVFFPTVVLTIDIETDGPLVFTIAAIGKAPGGPGGSAPGSEPNTFTVDGSLILGRNNVKVLDAGEYTVSVLNSSGGTRKYHIWWHTTGGQ